MITEDYMKDNIQKNLGIWILIGLLIFSIYSHYKTGEKFTEVCIDIVSLEQGYFDIQSNETFTPSGIDIDAIILSVKERKKLLDSNSTEGRAYRWYRMYSDNIKDICNNRLTRPLLKHKTPNNHYLSTA